MTDNELLSTKDPTERIERYAFFTKYVFSCLTDADFLDTEIFCNENSIVLIYFISSTKESIFTRISLVSCCTESP